MHTKTDINEIINKHLKNIIFIVTLPININYILRILGISRDQNYMH